jgi:hypothetical protein
VLRHVHPGFAKADMLLRPALVFDRRHREPAVAVFEGVRPGSSVEGWVALEDDDTKRKRQGSASVRIEVRASGSETWTSLYNRRMPHRPGRVPLDLPLDDLAGAAVDVRVSSTTDGKRPPELAVSLSLDGGAP